jgi:hypothetical protein
MQPAKDHDDRLRLDYALRHDERLAGRLLDDPDGVLGDLGVGAEALECPEQAHAARERAEKPAAELTRLGEDAPLTDALKQARPVLEPALGDDFLVERVPFGLRFAERVGSVGLDLTGTGTVECTFGLKCSPDVDG